MKITLVCGSTSKKSHTFVLLKYLEELVKEKGAETSFWDLKERLMVFAVPEFHKNPIQTADENVQQFIKLVESSDGLIVGSPLYHGSYSGVLKNALDNLYTDAFRNKAIGLVGHGAGSRSSINVCEHLRGVVRTLYGYSLQTQISTGTEDYGETDGGFVLENEDIKRRCLVMVNELIILTKVLQENKITQK